MSEKGSAGRRRTLELAAAPASIFLAGQALTLTIVALIAAGRDRSIAALLTSWDGLHFIEIARRGYSASVSAGVSNSVAFFPGYPAAVRAAKDLTGAGYEESALLISLGAGVVLAYGLVRLVGLVIDDAALGERTGRYLVLLVSCGPLAVVFSMAYSEALFCALAVWALIYILERRWLAAAALIIVAGSVRQTALALCMALAVAVVREARTHRTNGTRWSAWCAVAVAPAGVVGWLVMADQITGVRGSWFAAERNGWGSRFDFGVATAEWAYRTVLYAPAVLDVATLLLLAGALALLVSARQLPAAVLTYSAGVVVLDELSAGIMNSKVRLLVPAIALLFPAARRLARLPIRQAAGWVAGFAVLGAWYSAYALIIYGYAI